MIDPPRRGRVEVGGSHAVNDKNLDVPGYALVLAPTVVAELFFLSSHGDAEEQRLAKLSLAQIVIWDIQVFTLTEVQMALARRFALAIIGRSLLP